MVALFCERFLVQKIVIECTRKQVALLFGPEERFRGKLVKRLLVQHVTRRQHAGKCAQGYNVFLHFRYSLEIRK